MYNKNQKAFTMIELIFVIVIIGILAAVAIPKLNASRYDAKVLAVVLQAKQLLQDVHTFYTSQGKSAYVSNATKIGMVTSIPLHLDVACSKPRPEQRWYGKTMYLCEDGVPVLMITMTNDTSLAQQSIFYKAYSSITNQLIMELSRDTMFTTLTNPTEPDGTKKYIISGITVKR
ncbi:MAG: Unknown protein [uncultured Sulfurovum sp.]|uniref:Uncharacterized protein n=1 Tax=uncultured Sulfurovum sp. TaxID=269237 RepID=A0A6S6TPE2_9BACT|nr:MAG: Unknown protein [uncultured Sulfurovum sp.]